MKFVALIFVSLALSVSAFAKEKTPAGKLCLFKQGAYNYGWVPGTEFFSDVYNIARQTHQCATGRIKGETYSGRAYDYSLNKRGQPVIKIVADQLSFAEVEFKFPGCNHFTCDEIP